MKENGLIRKVRLTWLARNCNINIAQYLNISKYNPTIKFGKLIEYNMRNIFLENHTQNVPDPFLKNQNSAYLWFKSLKFYTVFLLYAKLRAIKRS